MGIEKNSNIKKKKKTMNVSKCKFGWVEAIKYILSFFLFFFCHPMAQWNIRALTQQNYVNKIPILWIMIYCNGIMTIVK